MQSKPVSKAKKSITKCYIFKRIFEHVRHFSEHYAHPVETLEAQGYTLVDENTCFKTYTGGIDGAVGGYEYVCLVETPEQDYVILLQTWREYVTFVRNFAMIPKVLFERLVPKT
jgi:hypothetical protein